MKPCLGIDYGHKRIGFALSDGLYLTAHAKGVILVEKTNLIKQVVDLVQHYDVSRIIVGMPFSLDGTENKKTQEVRQFIDTLQTKINLPIHEWNESLTTYEAYRILSVKQVKGIKKTKSQRDALSAQVILQDYLDCKRHEIIS